MTAPHVLTDADIERLLGNPHPVAAMFPVSEGEEFDALVDSIRDHGLGHPIVLDPEGQLLVGRNRLCACREAGVEPRFTTYDGDDVVDYIVRANLHRRHLTNDQRAMLAVDLLPFYEAEAKERQAQAPGARRGTKKVTTVGATRPTETARRARDDAAKSAGTSGRSVARAKRVAEKAPELAEQVKSGTLDLGRADAEVSAREKAERAEPTATKRATTSPKKSKALSPLQRRAQMMHLLDKNVRTLNVCLDQVVGIDWSRDRKRHERVLDAIRSARTGLDSAEKRLLEPQNA
jgi:ParB-like chromosome segregation protein Spo0J